MPREKEGYRDMVALLMEQGYEGMIDKKDAAKIIGRSDEYINTLISKGKLKVVCKKIPIGSIASLLCG